MLSRAVKAPAHPDDITYAELLPFLSFRDLRKRAFLWPGLTTALFGVAMLLLAGIKNEDGFFWALSSFVWLTNIYLVFLWCGKKMPFPYILGITVFAFLLDFLLLKPIVIAEVALWGPISPGLVEETVKALPILIVWFFGRFLSHAGQRKYGVREPLDGIILAAASASGFAFLETMFLYVPKYGAMIGTPRVLINVFGHIAYSAAFGYYIGLAALHHHKPKRVVAALLLGFFIANGLHDAWDAVRYLPIPILSPLQLVVIAVASFVILASMILKAREVSPEHEFLWPFAAMPPYLAPEVQPLPEMPQMPGDCWLAIGAKRLPLSAGAELTGADISGLAAASNDGVVAAVVPHPSDPDMLVLRNLSRSKWEAVRVDGSVRDVNPAETIRLIPGTRIDFGGSAAAILLTPHEGHEMASAVAPAAAAQPAPTADAAGQ